MKTPNNRWFSLALAVPAFLLLTGAKGEGCGGDVIIDPPPAAEECPAGYHMSTVCDDVPEPVSADSEGAEPTEPGCREECVPDDVCPEGTMAVEICEAVALPCEWDGTSDMPDCMEIEPAPAECYTSCEPVCPAGTHADWVCYDEPIVSDPPDSGSGEEPPAPAEPSECFLECVPGACPAGYYEVVACETPSSAPETGFCWTECVPEEPACPPGCYAEGYCPGSDGSEPPGECVTVCRCDEPSEPPSEPEEPPQAS